MTTQPDTRQEPETETTKPWIVVLYNDDVHAFDDVVLQVQKATGKSEAEAYRITLEAHTKGRSVAFQGELTECQRVAGVLRRIRLQVEVDEG